MEPTCHQVSFIIIFFLWKKIIQFPILLKLFAVIFVLLKLSSFYHVFGRFGFYQAPFWKIFPPTVSIYRPHSPHLRPATFQSPTTVLILQQIMPLSLLKYFPRIIQSLEWLNRFFLVRNLEKISTITLPKPNTHGQYRIVTTWLGYRFHAKRGKDQPNY